MSYSVITFRMRGDLGSEIASVSYNVDGDTFKSTFRKQKLSKSWKTVTVPASTSKVRIEFHNNAWEDVNGNAVKVPTNRDRNVIVDLKSFVEHMGPNSKDNLRVSAKPVKTDRNEIVDPRSGALYAQSFSMGIFHSNGLYDIDIHRDNIQMNSETSLPSEDIPLVSTTPVSIESSSGGMFQNISRTTWIVIIVSIIVIFSSSGLGMMMMMR